MTELIKVVGLTGLAGSGKDFMARELWENLGFMPVALADHLRVDVAVRENFTFSDVFTTKGPAVRDRLQQYGTEEVRDVYGKEYWITCLWHWMRIYGRRIGQYKFAVTDVRFPNESIWVRQQLHGIVIRLEGGDSEQRIQGGLRQHSSESEQHLVKVDHTVDNCKANQDNSPFEVSDIVQARFLLA